MVYPMLAKISLLLALIYEDSNKPQGNKTADYLSLLTKISLIAFDHILFTQKAIYSC